MRILNIFIVLSVLWTAPTWAFEKTDLRGIDAVKLRQLNKKSLLSIGNEGGHGGDGYAVDFVNLGKEILNHLGKAENHVLVRSTGVDLKKFKLALNRVRVYSRDASEMTLNTEELDAINFPSRGEILINRARWYKASLNQKLKVVLHEYFGIMNVERDTYEISMRYEAAINSLTKELLTFSQKNQTFPAVCEKAAPLVLGTVLQCDGSDPGLEYLKECARAKALDACQKSSGSLCQVVYERLASFLSSENIGYMGCRATAIAR